MAEETERLLDTMRLTTTGSNRFVVPGSAVEPERDVVFGGEMLAQSIAASAYVGEAEREVKSIHAVFARPGRYSQDYELDVEIMHGGRSFSSHCNTVTQGGAIVSRMLLLHSADEPDLLAYTSVSMPDVAGPEDSPVLGPELVFPGTDWRIVGGVDTSLPDMPPADPLLQVWIRYGGDVAIALPAFGQGLLAWATDGYFIGTSMLPDSSINDAQTHREISTGVVSHTVNFHRPFDPSSWLLLSHEVAWAGRGRIHGRGLVFTQDGQLVASFTQDAMVRPFSARSGAAADPKRVM